MTTIIRVTQLREKLAEDLGLPYVLHDIIAKYCVDLRLERLFAMMKPGICQYIIFPYGTTMPLLKHVNIIHDHRDDARCSSGDDMLNHSWRIVASFMPHGTLDQSFECKKFVEALDAGKLNDMMMLWAGPHINPLITRFEREFAQQCAQDESASKRQKL